MRLVFQEEKNAWAVEYEGKVVAIGGTTYFTEKADALAQIHERGLTVSSSGEIIRVQALELPAEEPVEAAEAPAEPEVVEERPEPPAVPVDEGSEPAKPKRRGRPRERSEEEAKERRREQNRRYYAQREERRKREIAERAREWWQSHPEKVATYRQNANERRRERYQNDPEYRAQVIAANKAYQERRKAAKRAQE